MRRKSRVNPLGVKRAVLAKLKRVQSLGEKERKTISSSSEPPLKSTSPF